MTDHSADSDELDRILRERLVVSRYQSIVDLRTQRTVGFEAFARGPQDSPLELPGRLFAAAQQSGRLEELDTLCRARAIEGFDPPASSGDAPVLFVNAVPRRRSRSIAEEYRASTADRAQVPVVFEFPDRALVARPADLIGAGRELRRVDVGIGIDDVGLDPQSFSLLGPLRPRAVKLHMQLVHHAESAHSARVARALGELAEETGAWVVAKGIETARHLSAARAIGASHGQGWLYSNPDA